MRSVGHPHRVLFTPEDLVEESRPVDTAPEGFQVGFDEELAGRYAECDGGFMDAEGNTGRDDFAGTLTGVYMEEGDPPTRWYLLGSLTKMPPNYMEQAVWCERNFLFIEGE